MIESTVPWAVHAASASHAGFGAVALIFGALLVFALMVTPAAVAQNLTTSPYAGMALSAAVAVLAVWLGLTLAFYIAYPVSFFITALAFGFFIVSLVIIRTRRKAARI